MSTAEVGETFRRYGRCDGSKRLNDGDDSDSGLDNLSDAGSQEDLSPVSDSDDSGKEVDLPVVGTLVPDLQTVSNDEDVTLEGLPTFFKELAQGQTEAIDFNVTLDSRPHWLDVEKFKRGQKFAAENMFRLNFAEILSLFMLFSQKSALRPLIFTGKSDTPFKAFKRYLNTNVKLKSWYEDDIWGEDDTAGKKNLNAVMRMHKGVFIKLTETPVEELEEKTTLGDPNTTALWCPLKNVVLEDFKSSCPVRQFHFDDVKGKVWINQMDMSITQFGFVGLAVTYPSYFGLHSVTDDELDAFLHMWRGLGYLLGIKDKYNFCNADLQTVQQRTRDFIEISVKPSFREITEDWEHMCRCLVRGIAFFVPAVEFESLLLYLCYTIGIDMPRLKKSITLRQYIRFQWYKFGNFMQRFPSVRISLNKKIIRAITLAEGASPEVLAQWESTEFEYTQQPEKRQIQS